MFACFKIYSLLYAVPDYMGSLSLNTIRKSRVMPLFPANESCSNVNYDGKKIVSDTSSVITLTPLSMCGNHKSYTFPPSMKASGDI